MLIFISYKIYFYFKMVLEGIVKDVHDQSFIKN